jgi:hypothetical protein
MMPRLPRREGTGPQDEVQIPQKRQERDLGAPLRHPKVELAQDHMTEGRWGHGPPCRETLDRSFEYADPGIHLARQGQGRSVGQIDAEQQRQAVTLEDLASNIPEYGHPFRGSAHQ